MNKTHKLQDGANVTYTVSIDSDAYFPRFNAIGSNKTNEFNTATICLPIVAEPSYNIGELNDDTSLYVTLSGQGKLASDGKVKIANGYVAGTIGCGCKAYGHISPTRKIGIDGPTGQVDDVAATYGRWRMRFISPSSHA